jgi:hypothetical protein
MNRSSAGTRPLIMILATLIALQGAEYQRSKGEGESKQPTTSEIPGEFHGTWAYTDPNQEGSNTLMITRSTIQWSRTCEGTETVRQGRYSLKDQNRVVAFQSRRATSFHPFPLTGKCTPASMGPTTVTLRQKGENLLLYLGEAQSESPTMTITVPAATYVCRRIK